MSNFHIFTVSITFYIDNDDDDCYSTLICEHRKLKDAQFNLMITDIIFYCTTYDLRSRHNKYAKTQKLSMFASILDFHKNV